MIGRVISEAEFAERVVAVAPTLGPVAAVTGPGRSGAVAAVYVSHVLGVPFIPFKANWRAGHEHILIADTASESGATLRKAEAWYRKRGQMVIAHAFYIEPPRVRFWYEWRRFAGMPEFQPLAERLGAGLQIRPDGFDSRAAVHFLQKDRSNV